MGWIFLLRFSFIGYFCISEQVKKWNSDTTCNPTYEGYFMPAVAEGDNHLSDDVISTTLPFGHLLPIGNQRPVSKGKIIELTTTISGPAFYRDFLAPGVPVIFRGAIKHARAFRNWKNETYLRHHCASMVGGVDHRKKWERGGREMIPRKLMKFNDFLDRYQHEDVYWEDEIPEDSPILKDMPFPFSLNCEDLIETIHYYGIIVNSGNVSYVVHVDHVDNFYYLLSGEKTWLVAHASYKEAAYIGKDTQSQDLSPVNPDSVDLIKYPRISDIEFHELKLKAGDILFMPKDWVHHVKSYGTPNIALNIWFGGESYTGKKLKCRKQRRTAKQIFDENFSQHQMI